MNKFNFTSDDIIQAFENIEYKPCRQGWAKRGEDGQVCEVCAISALAVSKDLVKADEIMSTIADQGSKVLSNLLEIDYEYMWAFIHGFDSNLSIEDYYDDEIVNISEERKEAFKLGQETANKIFGGKQNDNSF